MAALLEVGTAIHGQGSPVVPATSWSGCLTTVPLDIFLLIYDRLPVASRIAVALTCKSLFTSLYPAPKLPILGKEDLVDLLLLLEKDNPDYFLCFGCTRLRPLDPRQKLGWWGHNYQVCGDEIEHTWYTDWYQVCGRSRRRNYREQHSEKVQPLSWRPQTKAPEVTFSEAHLAMNRHLYGEPHGISFRTLQRHFDFERCIALDGSDTNGDHFPLEQHPTGRCHLTRSRRKMILWNRARMETWPFPLNTFEVEILDMQADTMVRLPLNLTPILPWKFKHNYAAEIVDGELYMASFHHITGPAVPIKKFTMLLNCTRLKVCRHLFCCTVSTLPNPGCYECIPQVDVLLHLRHVDKVQQRSVDCDRDAGSCRYCFTDYLVSIRGGDEKTDWTLELSTYHRLGSCRTPDDPVWRSLTNFSLHMTRHLDHPEFGPGEVRRRWHQSDGEDVDQEMCS